ncbi:hypothetical protein DSM104299_03088 [Baekduia alba]|uniref:hypothetical protein n=1 Tax=Baekduia alba TaxID=2997333 RepID=UPI0023417953|nr:hypothetical protein [Baekduia alba]WCB94354.1 hypothetical protein DSM104299_03088 [Baekduia alba]
MAMAGDFLTGQQRVLWKMYDQHGGVGFMTDDELRDWASACRILMDYAAAKPASATQARALWAVRLAEAEGALAERAAAAG